MYAVNYNSILCELFWYNIQHFGYTSAPCAVMICTQSVGSAPAERVEQIIKYMQDQSTRLHAAVQYKAWLLNGLGWSNEFRIYDYAFLAL